MKSCYRLFSLPLAVGLLMLGQEGPKHEGSETVAKPRTKKDAGAADEPTLPKIPSKLNPKNNDVPPEGSPSFKVDTNVVSVDVAVMDDKGHFIPNIPRGNFRI